MERPRLIRGLAILAGAALALAVVSPAFSAHTNAHLQEDRPEGDKKLLTPRGRPCSPEETEFDRVEALRMNAGDPDQPLFTFGPFTTTVRCDLDVGDVRASVRIQT